MLLTRSALADLERGLLAAATVQFLAPLWLYLVAAPTPDMRARIEFLVASAGWRDWLILWALFLVLGAVGVAAVGKWRWRSFAGIPVSAVAMLLIVQSNLLPAIVPGEAESEPHYVLLALGIIAAVVSLWHLRSRGTQATGAQQSNKR